MWSMLAYFESLSYGVRVSETALLFCGASGTYAKVAVALKAVHTLIPCGKEPAALRADHDCLDPNSMQENGRLGSC